MPVWPTCFWICWPTPPPPSRLPAAMTPISFIVTPPSFSAALTASAARSTTSLSGCLPNFVIVMPRIQMSSVAMSWSPLVSVQGSVQRLEAEVHGLGSFVVRADDLRRQAHLHPEADVLGVGRG